MEIPLSVLKLIGHQTINDSEIVPEIRLVAAVLCRAILDIVGPNVFETDKRMRTEKRARAWIFTFDDDEEEPFSFAWCCKTLGLRSNEAKEAIVKLIHSCDTKQGTKAIMKRIG